MKARTKTGKARKTPLIRALIKQADVIAKHTDKKRGHQPRKNRRKRRREHVNHPSHYGGDTTYEAIKVIEAWKLGFNLGTVAKYLCRSEHKGAPITDLEKAAWYLNREIALRKGRARK